jgi:hypothetical protein
MSRRMAWAIILAWAAWEVYLSLRPIDWQSHWEEFRGSAHGRFEQFYADRERAYRDAPLGN